METLLAASPQIVAELGTGTLKTWIEDNVIVIIVLIAAAAALWAGSIGKISKVITIVGGVFLGLVLVGIAIGSGWETIADWLPSLIGA